MAVRRTMAARRLAARSATARGEIAATIARGHRGSAIGGFPVVAAVERSPRSARVAAQPGDAGGVGSHLPLITTLHDLSLPGELVSLLWIVSFVLWMVAGVRQQRNIMQQHMIL